MSKTTSQVFPCATRLFAVVSAITWPAHPAVGVASDSPLVVFGGLMPADATNEPIVIKGSLPRSSSIDFATLSTVNHQEQFVLQVTGSTLHPGQPGDVVWQRLADLAAAIQVSLRNQTTGKPTGGFGINDANGCTAIWWLVANVDAEVAQGDEGIVGRFALDIAFTARI